MEGGKRCTFSSWKYSQYFELLKKKQHTNAGPRWPKDSGGKYQCQTQALAENLNSNRDQLKMAMPLVIGLPSELLIV